MPKTPAAAIRAVEALGFTALEALVYVELLRSGPQSGYRIAQLVGKAPANAYKTLESLAARGAVLCNDGGTKVFRAVPYAQVAAALAADFGRRSQLAQDVLAHLDAPSNDDGIYQIAREDQALEHARTLIAGAQRMLLIDAFPRALDALSADLAKAAARGVHVAIVKYRTSPAVSGAFEVLTPDGDDIIAGWFDEYLAIGADASSIMIALLSGDGDASGIVTSNRHLAWSYYAGFYHDMRFVHLSALAISDPAMPLAKAIAASEGLVPRDTSRRPRTKKS